MSEKGLSAVLHNIAHEMVSLWIWSHLPLNIVCSNNSKFPIIGAPSAEGLYFSVFLYTVHVAALFKGDCFRC